MAPSDDSTAERPEITAALEAVLVAAHPRWQYEDERAEALYHALYRLIDLAEGETGRGVGDERRGVADSARADHMTDPTAGDVFQPLMDAVGALTHDVAYMVIACDDCAGDTGEHIGHRRAAVRHEAEGLVLRAKAETLRALPCYSPQRLPQCGYYHYLCPRDKRLEEVEARLAAWEVKE